MVASKISESYYSYDLIGFEQRLIFNDGRLVLVDLNSKKIVKEFAGTFEYDFIRFEMIARALYSEFITLRTSY